MRCRVKLADEYRDRTNSKIRTWEVDHRPAKHFSCFNLQLHQVKKEESFSSPQLSTTINRACTCDMTRSKLHRAVLKQINSGVRSPRFTGLQRTVVDPGVWSSKPVACIRFSRAAAHVRHGRDDKWMLCLFTIKANKKKKLPWPASPGHKPRGLGYRRVISRAYRRVISWAYTRLQFGMRGCLNFFLARVATVRSTCRSYRLGGEMASMYTRYTHAMRACIAYTSGSVETGLSFPVFRGRTEDYDMHTCEFWCSSKESVSLSFR